MRLSQKQRKFTVMVGNFILWAHSQGYEFTIGHVWRDKETQARLLAEGLSRTHNSKHLDKLAIDINLYVNDAYTADGEDYRALGEYWEGLDPKNRWGGNFKGFFDAGHFEYAG